MYNLYQNVAFIQIILKQIAKETLCVRIIEWIIDNQNKTAPYFNDPEPSIIVAQNY